MAKKDVDLEAPVRFHFDPPFDTNSVHREEQVEFLMWDYGKWLRTPRKEQEKFNEHFSLALGYNVSLFVLQDGRSDKSTFYI